MLLGFGIVTATGAPLGAQGCRPPEHPYFDFQVDRPAELVEGSARSPRPVTPERGRAVEERLIIQFVVDTLGVGDTASIRVLRSADADLELAARRAFVEWRYRPALVANCKVPQLVQTAVRP
jgi:hypothetical protein